MKCPRCHKGALFVTKNPFNFKKLDSMPQKCGCCGQRTEPEPGFYYGAMYVSYALGTALFLTLFFSMILFFEVPDLVFLGTYIFLMLTLWGAIFKYARVIYIYIFVRFDPQAITKYKEKHLLDT
ncbi:DUF983 domain-containing protein [Cytophagaceae bacterium ABcell3]|nr:DUF983 domain-containing protein [Cytophagaceae bacterium ABcell3]